MSGSYYKQIKGIKYDRELLEAANDLTTGKGDGRISKDDAAKLWEDAEDGPGVTDCEHRTLQYILDNYKCTDAASKFLQEQLHKGDEDNEMDVEEELPIKKPKTTPGSGRRTSNRTPSPALNRRTITRYEDKRDMDVNNYTLEMRIKFCKDLRLLAEQIEETKQRILDKVEIDVQERTAVTQAENNDLEDKISDVLNDKERLNDFVKELRARLKQLQSECKDVAARRPKVESERTEMVERRRRVKEEEEDLREALAVATKAGNDLRREIAAMETGVVDLRRKAVLKADECEKMSAHLPVLQTEIDTNTVIFRKEQTEYEEWMKSHGLDPTANWNIAGAEQIEALRQLLRREFAEALAHREAQIDAENAEEWNTKNDRLAELRDQEQEVRQQELAVRDQLARVITERDDLDAEIKAIKMVIQQLRDAKDPDADHNDRMARVRELQAQLKDLEDQLIPLRARELELTIEHEKIKAAVANERPVLEAYLKDIELVKAKRIKAEKEVAKSLRVIEAAMSGYRANEMGLINEIQVKDDKINDLQKKVEELQREKLNADWISLQEEITEYKVILTGWCDEMPMSPPKPAPVYEPEDDDDEEEQEEAPAPPQPVQPKPEVGKKRKRIEDDTDAGDQDTDTACVVM